MNKLNVRSTLYRSTYPRGHRIVSEANKQLTSHESEWVTGLRRIALSPTAELLESVKDAKTKEELEELFQGVVQAITPDIDGHFTNIGNTLSEWAKNLQDNIEELDTIELGENIRIPRVPEPRSGNIEEPRTQGYDFVKASRKILGDGLGLLLGQASDNTKPLIKLVGRFKKFGPWGKIRLGTKLKKVTGRAGKVAGPLMVVLDLIIEYRDEKIHDEKERQLAKKRLSMRREVQNMADWHVEEFRKTLDSIRKDTIHKMLHQLEEQAAAIIADEAKEKGAADLASRFIIRSRSLRNEISAEGD